MNPATLYVTDLDGTLLNNGSMVSPRSADILADLSASGAMITVATARTPATVVPLLEGTGLSLPYIVMTGAATFSAATMTYGDIHLLPPADVTHALSVMNQEGVNPFVYGFDGDDPSGLTVWHTPEMTPWERDFYEERRDLPLKRFRFSGPCNPHSVPLLFATSTAPALQAVADRLRPTGRYSISLYPDIFRQGMMLMELFAPNVSKAAAIAAMARRVRANRIVAFGDNLNDLPMLRLADVAVAVANAHPAVRAAAHIVIGPNYDDSVPRFILDDQPTDIR